MSVEMFLVPFADHAELERIRRTARRLPAKDPVRRIADELLSGIEPSPGAVEECISALGQQSPTKWRRKQLAAWALGVLPIGEDAIGPPAESLARVVDNFDLHRDSGGRAVRGIARSMAALGGGTLLAMILGASFWIAFPVGFVSWVLAMPASLLWDHRSVNMVREEAARALGRVYAPEYLGALTQAANDPSHGVKWAAVRALHRLIPRILNEPDARVPRDVGSKLCGLLRGANLELASLVLTAIPVLAGPEAISTVERVADRSKSPELRAQASAILPGLYEVRDRYRKSETLLRPAEVPSTDTLLRAASSVATSEPELLLRPTAGEDA